ncbi:MAG: HAD-IA family hydrolase [Clostridiales bacterium]|nr:HAD-IA family hydrolase [Clostridiales bacterium]
MSKFDTILFDFDGTIMDTNNVIIMSWQHTFRTLENREEKVDNIVKTFGEPLEITMKRFFPDVPVERSLETYRSFHRDNFGELIKMFPGMRELLAEVKKRGYKIGLVTSRLLPTTMEGLEKYDIIDYFDGIVAAEDTTKHKPDPEPVNIALKKLGSSAGRAIMLGDTMFDIKCAANAGVKSVLVSWSLALKGQKDFVDNAPDYIIDKAEELLEIL